MVDVPPYSITALEQARRSEECRVTIVGNAAGFQLENEFISVQLTAQGQVVSLIERASGRQCVLPGQTANQLVLYEDLPYNFDAWNVDVYYREKELDRPLAFSARIIEDHPLRCAVQFEYKIGAHSSLDPDHQLICRFAPS